jgi:tRNA1Val (adenine37-N6)-methyltransferase
MRKPFQFKQFSISDTNSAMKVSTDAVLLGAWTKPDHANKILDVGTGSGIIALMLAQHSNAQIDAIDIHEPSLSDAEVNFKNSKWVNKLNLYQSSFNDFINACDREYDLIVSNPPYYNNCLQSPHEETNLARHTSNLNHRELISGIKKILSREGRFTVILPVSESQNFKDLASSEGFRCKQECLVFPNANKPANRVLFEFGSDKPEKDSTSSLYIRNSEKLYHPSYIELTKDFYLNF